GRARDRGGPGRGAVHPLHAVLMVDAVPPSRPSRHGSTPSAPTVTPSTWVEIPPPPQSAPHHRWSRLLTRLLLPLAFAALLWWLGLTVAAIVVTVAVVVL